jgi:hypothetical protein
VTKNNGYCNKKTGAYDRSPSTMEIIRLYKSFRLTTAEVEAIRHPATVLSQNIVVVREDA